MFGEHPEGHGGILGDGPVQGQDSRILVGSNSAYSMISISLGFWQGCRSGSEQQVEAEGHISQTTWACAKDTALRAQPGGFGEKIFAFVLTSTTVN